MELKLNRKICFLSILILLLLIFSIYYFVNQVEANCLHRGINIYNGDIRTQRYVCFIKIWEKIESSSFSQKIRKLGLPISEEQLWERVDTKTFIVESHINYKYGGIITRLDMLIMFLDSERISEEKQQVLLKEILEYLQKGDITQIDKKIQSLMQSAKN